MDSGSQRAGCGPSAGLEDAFKADRRFLWGLCYRLTGSAADADDLVQETFARALEHPPPRPDEPWRPWLVRVAMNLGRDLLRRRKRRRYVGPWLPAPIETGGEDGTLGYEPVLEGGQTTEGRYDLLESVSFAFLVALEALTPQQRAVLLLRDVFDYCVRDTAAALGISEANVKTTLHRARRALRGYDAQRCIPTRELQERTRAVVERFVASLAGGDVAAVEALLADAVRSVNDGAGEYFAARVPVLGRRRVAHFYWKINRLGWQRTRAAVRMLNGLPGLVADVTGGRPGEPPRLALSFTIDADDRITRIDAVVASRKLTAIDFRDLATPPAA